MDCEQSHAVSATRILKLETKTFGHRSCRKTCRREETRGPRTEFHHADTERVVAHNPVAVPGNWNSSQILPHQAVTKQKRLITFQYCPFGCTVITVGNTRRLRLNRSNIETTTNTKYEQPGQLLLSINLNRFHNNKTIDSLKRP